MSDIVPYSNRTVRGGGLTNLPTHQDINDHIQFNSRVMAAARAPTNPSRQATLDKKQQQTLSELGQFVSDVIKAHKNKSKELPSPINHVDLWRLMFRAVETSPDFLFPSMFNNVALYRSIYPEFSADPPGVLIERLNDVRDRSKSFSKRMQVAKVLIRVLPFIEELNAIDVIEAAVDIVANHLSQKHELPKEILETFADVMVADFTAKTFELVWNYFREKFYDEDETRANATIAIFSEMCLAFAVLDDEIVKACDNLVFDTLDPENGRDRKLVGLAFLHKYAHWYSHEPDDLIPSVEKFMHVLAPLLNSPDVSLALMSHKATKTLIKVGRFRKSEDIDALLELYEDYEVQMRPQFFGLLKTLVSVFEEENEDVTKLVPVRDLIFAELEKEKQEISVIGLCIDVLGDLISFNRRFVGKGWELGWEKCQQIFAKKSSNEYPRISSFVVGICRLHPEKQTEAREYVMKMVDHLSANDRRTISARMDMAIDIAELIKIGVLDSVPSVLAAFATRGVSSDSQQDAVRACAVILEAIPAISQKTASVAFEKIAQHAVQADDIQVFQFFVKTLRKIFARFDVKGKAVDNFIGTILNGALVNFPGIAAPALSECAKFMNLFIKKFPEHFGKVLSVYDRYLEAMPRNPLLLAPYMATMQYCPVNVVNYEKMWEIGRNFLLKCRFQDVPGALASIECMNETLLRAPHVCTSGSDVVIACMKWIEKADLQYQDDQKMAMLLEMMPEICLLFLLLASAPNPTDIEPDVLKNLMNFMPFPPKVKAQERILNCLVKMLPNPKFSFLVTRGCTVIIELLVLDEKSFSEFEFSQETVDALKQMIRNVVGKNPQTRKKVVSRMINASRDQQALSELLD